MKKPTGRGGCYDGKDARTRHYPLVRTDVLHAKHELRHPIARLLDRRAARDDEPDGLPESALDLCAHCGPEHNARVERDELHRHIRGALLWPPRRRCWVWPRRVRLVVWRIWLGQECLGECVERQVRADPARRQEVAPVEREVRAWVRRVEQFRGRLRSVLGDEDLAGAGRRVAELCGGWLRG